MAWTSQSTGRARSTGSQDRAVFVNPGTSRNRTAGSFHDPRCQYRIRPHPRRRVRAAPASATPALHRDLATRPSRWHSSQDGRLRVHVHLDERSAAFFALGVRPRARAGPPSCAARRERPRRTSTPPCSRQRTGGCRCWSAPRTARPSFVTPAPARPSTRSASTAGPPAGPSTSRLPPTVPGSVPGGAHSPARAAASALRPPAGPVHLNLAFREPLAPTGAALVDAPGRADGRPWTVTTPTLRRADPATVQPPRPGGPRRDAGRPGRGLGQRTGPPASSTRFARATGWPVLADPLSGLRACTGARVDLRRPAPRRGVRRRRHRPDLVIRLGRRADERGDDPVAGRRRRRVAPRPGRSVARPGAHARPNGSPSDPGRLSSPTSWPSCPARPHRRHGGTSWQDADRHARQRRSPSSSPGSEEPFEGRIARDVVAALPEAGTLVVASSMPVRDVDTFAEPRADVPLLANRGVNGIDGFASTTLGVAAATGHATVGLTGDLSFLHDTNGLLGAAERDLDATFVVVDNRRRRDLLVPSLPAPGRARAVRTGARDAAQTSTSPTSPAPTVSRSPRPRRHPTSGPRSTTALAAGGVRIVRVRTDRHANVARHGEVFAAVAAALRPT